MMLLLNFFYACAIPFNVARSPYFKNVLKKAIDFGKGYVPPGSEALTTTLLDLKMKKTCILENICKLNFTC
jgi:hypothetical protein